MKSNPSATKKDNKARKRTLNAIMISVALHVAFIFAAMSLTIMVIMPKSKVTFEGKKHPSLPARKLEHSIRVKQMQKQTRKPQIMQRLVTEAPSKVALPNMPEMRTPDVKSLRDTPLMNSAAGSIGSIGSGGGGAGRGLGGGMGYSDTKFFGENIRTRAISICMDISPSMISKGVVADVADEVSAMLDTMNVNTKFNIIVFVDGADPFSTQMVFATQENKKAALAWLQKGFNPSRDGQLRGFSGSTPHLAIKMAVEQGADTVFILSDDPPYLAEGNAQNGVEIVTHKDDIMDFVKNIERDAGRQVRMYPILYKPHNSKRGLEGQDYYKRLARTTGGKSRVVDDPKSARRK